MSTAMLLRLLGTGAQSFPVSTSFSRRQPCSFPPEVMLQIFGSVSNGKTPGCSICRFAALHRVSLVCRVGREAATRELYERLDLSFIVSTEERGACRWHQKMWGVRDSRHAFRRQGEMLRLLVRTMREAGGEGVSKVVRRVGLPSKDKYPWSYLTSAHPLAGIFGISLVDILQLLPCLEAVEGLGDLAAYANLEPGLDAVRLSVLRVMRRNGNWREWDWFEHQHPNQHRHLSHLRIDRELVFLSVHSGWKNLRRLSLGIVLLEEATANAFPFALLPSLRSLEVAGARSLVAMFEALPPNQLSSLTIQPGLYGNFVAEPLLTYLQRRPKEAPGDKQRLTSLKILAAVDSTRYYMYQFRLDRFLSKVLAQAPQLTTLHLALVPRFPVFPLPAQLFPEKPLSQLDAPGPKLKQLKLAISAHDWCWLLPSIKASLFPHLQAIAITPAQYIEDMNQPDGGAELPPPEYSYKPPTPRFLVKRKRVYYPEDFAPKGNVVASASTLDAQEEECRRMDMELVEFLEGEKAVSVRFISKGEEDWMLVGNSISYI